MSAVWEKIMADLRTIIHHPRATPETLESALTLAYQVGKAEGFHVGKLEGINETHAIQLQALDEISKKSMKDIK